MYRSLRGYHKGHEGPQRDTKDCQSGTADFTDFEQIKGVLAHADCQCVLDHRDSQRNPQRLTEKAFGFYHKEHEGPRRGTKGTARRKGRAVRARKAHVRPEGPERAWRASHAMLWGMKNADFADLVQIKSVLAHAGHRGRTYRTYRTYRTATAAALLTAYSSRACRAFCSPFSVLCSPGRRKPPLLFTVLCSLFSIKSCAGAQLLIQ